MDNLFQVLSICLELFVIVSTILVFFRGRLRFTGIQSLFFLCLLFAAATSSYFLFRRVFGDSISFQTVYSVYSLVLITFLLSWLFRETPFVVAFIVFAARNYMDGVNLLSKIASSVFWTAANEHMETAVIFLCQLTIYILFMPVLYHAFRRWLYPAIEDTRSLSIWKYLWLMPVSFYLLYRLCIVPLSLSDPHGWDPSFSFLSMVWCLGMFFCQLALFRLLSESSQNLLLTEKLRSTELLTEMEKKQYGLLQDNIEEARKSRHDLRHHLLALRGYAKLEDFEGCLRYIDQYLSQTENFQMKKFCDNYAVNSIISYYAQAAGDGGVPMETQIQLPALLPIPEIDFCTILGNLLSNAVEATERQTEGTPFIRLNMGMAGGSMMAVSVINSYSGEIQEKNGVFLSSHHADEGIGTMSIRHIAKKYHGLVKFQYEDGIFEASLLLNADAGK